jgi:hypothetical protein
MAKILIGAPAGSTYPVGRLDTPLIWNKHRYPAEYQFFGSNTINQVIEIAKDEIIDAAIRP